MDVAAPHAGPAPRIARYQAEWIRLPLERPYVIAYETLESFDLFITRVELEDGRVAFGEACPLPGYTSATADSLWEDMRRLVPELRGKDRAGAEQLLEPYAAERAFLVAALLSPLEWYDAAAGAPAQIEIPLIGTILGTTPDGMHADARELLLAGYRTLKMKVGLDIETDVENVRAVQSAVRAFGDATVRIRIDANQAYTFEQARDFLVRIEPEYVQLFEQPLGDERWDLLDRLPPTVPLMLDEWIVDEETIRRAARSSPVAFVKFKLMKAAGFERLGRLTEVARASGLATILGNGVAGDVGCLDEAVAAWRFGFTLAGEMNGFLKPRQRLLPASVLEARAGKLIARPRDAALSLDEAVIAASRIDRL
jgi:L-alanine-DL-glutamate epimerase-like enolase superfamily enzyme